MALVPPINHMAEPGFGSAGAALMAALAQHRGAQEHAANYQHPPSIPPAHAVGRPGESERQPVRPRRRRLPAAALGPMPQGGVPPMGAY